MKKKEKWQREATAFEEFGQGKTCLFTLADEWQRLLSAGMVSLL